MTDEEPAHLRASGGWDNIAARWEEKRPEPYTFLWEEGQWFTLPHMAALDWRLLDRLLALFDRGDLESEPDDDQQVRALQRTLSETIAGALGDEQSARWAATPQPLGKLMMLINGWRAHSQDSMGEAASSAVSSPSTAEQSRPTSHASTTSAFPPPSWARQASGTPPANS